ncbi:MAG: heme-copper oxidase subunit III [Verrucomicrobiota bacterium]
MSTAVLTHDSSIHHGASPATCKFGMIIFLFSEAMLFAGLIAGYFVLRWTATGFPWQPGSAWPPDASLPHLPVFLTSINTIFLVSSSFTFHFSEAQVQKGKSGLGLLALTILLGATFVVIQGFEWVHLYREGLWFDKGGIYGSSFFVITGFHGMHVAIGVLLIVWCFLRQSMTRCFTPQRHPALANVALYWHFVDVVWIFLFTLLYWV